MYGIYIQLHFIDSWPSRDFGEVLPKKHSEECHGLAESRGNAGIYFQPFISFIRTSMPGALACLLYFKRMSSWSTYMHASMMQFCLSLVPIISLRKKTQKRPGKKNNKHTELPKSSDDLGTFGTVKKQPPTSVEIPRLN